LLRGFGERRATITPPHYVDMSETTPLHGLYWMEPPMAWRRTEYTVPATVSGMKMFRVFGKMPTSIQAALPMQYVLSLVTALGSPGGTHLAHFY